MFFTHEANFIYNKLYAMAKNKPLPNYKKIVLNRIKASH